MNQIQKKIEKHILCESCGEIMGIEINDHIIVTKNGFFSFKEKNLI
jgi:DNA repair protein RadC